MSPAAGSSFAKGHGIAFADIDNDGTRTLSRTWARLFGDVYRKAVFENPGTATTGSKVKLVGVKSSAGRAGSK